MNSDLARRWTMVKQLFADALEKAPDARAAFVAQSCGGDPALRDELETLLAAHDHPEGLLDATPVSPAEDAGAQTARLASGARLGPYEIVDLLGEGGMGQVYRARDTRLGREVAVKVLAPGKRGQEAMRRFLREARAAGSLNHPNILDVHDVGAEESAPYIVSELLQGTTLRALIAGKQLPLIKALDYALQFAQGLSAAHDRGVVHRDLKPENLFITHDGRLKILDFGIAKLVQQATGDTASALRQEGTESEAALDTAGELARVPVRGSQPTTGRGTVLGTVNYMSPEQINGMSAGYRSDIFSAGVILYEMLAGKLPFAGDWVLQPGSAFVIDRFPVHVPQELQRIVRRCLEKDPENRFSSGRDLVLALARLSPVAPAERAVARRRVAVLVCGGSLLVGLLFAALPGLGFRWRTAERAPTSSTAAAPIATTAVGGTTQLRNVQAAGEETDNESAVHPSQMRSGKLLEGHSQKRAVASQTTRSTTSEPKKDESPRPTQSEPPRGEPAEPAKMPDAQASSVKDSVVAGPASNDTSKSIPGMAPALKASVDVVADPNLLAAREEAIKAARAEAINAETRGGAAAVDAWKRYALLSGNDAAWEKAAKLQETARAAAAQLREAERAKSEAFEAAERAHLESILALSSVPFTAKAEGVANYCQKYGEKETKRVLDLATLETRAKLWSGLCGLGCFGEPACGIVGLWRGNNAVSELLITSDQARVVFDRGDVVSGAFQWALDSNREGPRVIQFSGTNSRTGRFCTFEAEQTAANRVEGSLQCLFHRDVWVVHRERIGTDGH